MAFFNVWSPDTTALEGWLIETPIRTPDLPANLWVHWAGLTSDWAGFPPAQTNGDWHRGPGIVTAQVPAGDTVLAGQASLGISGAHREETTILNTDDWGMAFDSVGRLSARVEGPGAAVFPCSIATLGNCWPVGAALTVDLLVLRSSLIPAVPLPYGQHPKRDVWRDKIVQRATYRDELAGIADRAKVLKRLITDLDDQIEDGADRRPDLPPGLPRRATMGLSMSLTSAFAATPQVAGGPPKELPPSKGRPRKPRS